MGSCDEPRKEGVNNETRKHFEEYYEHCKTALAMDVLQWAESGGKDSARAILLGCHAGKLAAYRDILRALPVTEPEAKGAET